MRPLSRSLIAFLAGLVVGVVTAGIVVGLHWKRFLQDWEVGAILNEAYVAREIYAGRSNQLADRTRASLPSYVEMIEQEFPKAQGKDATYWMVSDVYQVTGMAVPTSLKPILAALPPRTSCKPPKKAPRGPAA